MTPDSVLFWYWWVGGILLLILEMFAPGAVFLWMAVSAAVTGLILMALPDTSFNAQLLIFAVLSVGSIVAYQLYRKKKPSSSADSGLNQRGSYYNGRIFTLTRAIENGVGEVRVDDSIWRVEGEDTPLGSKVKVLGSKGTSLLVEKVSE